MAAVQAYISGNFKTGQQITHNFVAGLDYNYSKQLCQRIWTIALLRQNEAAIWPASG
ncbi:hypothetical protein [Chitinophaga pinensis]|uniref:hypothetical protein n=1 Tax=Chitinophaga pinensis TaxID=79329 RepID=UPI0016489C17|nr:hypothetical protein [Chitinophaga pinensis]